MSPEQAEGKTLDHRSDIFSLGVMLYEMATGQRPFKGDTSVSVLSSIIKDSPRAVSDLKPALPRELARIVKHCLVKDPEYRYQSAKDLRNELRALEQESEVPGSSLGSAESQHVPHGIVSGPCGSRRCCSWAWRCSLPCGLQPSRRPETR
jgi:serine/threonine protein kinase